VFERVSFVCIYLNWDMELRSSQQWRANLFTAVLSLSEIVYVTLLSLLV